MFCPSCDGSAYCLHCGKPTASPTEPQAVQKKAGRPTLRIIGIGLLGVSGLLSGLLASVLPAQVPDSKAEALEKDYDINAALMKATFKLEGRTAQGQPTIGTAFVMGRPYLHPPADQPQKARYVLITAAHVLNEMQGDQAILHLRRKVNIDNWVRIPFPITIRASGQATWKKHPDADVAVMYIGLPKDIPIEQFSTNMLADDKMMEKYEIHPGDELKCLGYPFGLESNNAGFPVLRSGQIASYPLLPTASTRTFLFDFRVFQGNSGGPVYFDAHNRAYQGNLNIGNHVHFLVGLISGEEKLDLPYSQLQLGLAEVVHASLIKEAINSLPSPNTLSD